MPRKCCVPGCRGNYDTNEKVSVFSFPTDADRRRLWLKKIPRANFEPSSQSVVCEKHFSEKFVLKSDSVTRPDGSILTVERSKPKLRMNAYPSIFPNCPSYMSEEPPKKRKMPDTKRAVAQHRDEQAFKEWMDADKIADFSDFSAKLKGKVDSDVWILHSTDNTAGGQSPGNSYWSLYRIMDSPGTTTPLLVSAVRVFTDLRVEIFNGKIVRVTDSSLKWLFGQKSSPVLTYWSQFDTLLSHFSNSSTDGTDMKQQIQPFVDALHNCCSGAMVDCGSLNRGRPTKQQEEPQGLDLAHTQEQRGISRENLGHLLSSHLPTSTGNVLELNKACVRTVKSPASC